MEKIGFIGQGWIGKTYADDFEARGYETVRYGLEPEYAGNKEAVAVCDIVIIAVPTPTTPEGFDASIVEGVLELVGSGKIAVIKSTLLPGTTLALQAKYPDRIILHAPEFLRESNRVHDASHPDRNLIGIPEDSERFQEAAKRVLAVLPAAPYTQVMPATAAELVKYAGNVFLAYKVVFANMLYDLASALNLSYEQVQEAIAADPRIGPSHLSPVDASGHTDTPGRGAGGHCFIKDLEALRLLYASEVGDTEGNGVFDAVVAKNNQLLKDSGKDLDLLRGVYGSTV
jgi:UDPglucose 6-dehydrogenase